MKTEMFEIIVQRSDLAPIRVLTSLNSDGLFHFAASDLEIPQSRFFNWIMAEMTRPATQIVTITKLNEKE